MPWDLGCYRILVYVFEKVFELPAYWTVDEVCESITREADFRVEAANTSRARVQIVPLLLMSDTEQGDLVGSVQNVYVPLVEDEVLSKRIMCTEWIDGVKVKSLQLLFVTGSIVK